MRIPLALAKALLELGPPVLDIAARAWLDWRRRSSAK